VGGKFHLKLNIGSRPIANKYHEGKVKRTLKRELKVPEIAEREANATSPAWRDCRRLAVGVSRLVCHRRLEGEDDPRGMEARLRACECLGWNSSSDRSPRYEDDDEMVAFDPS
jgi:hypothetical protein